MIDTHCHLNLPDFMGQESIVLDRARREGVDQFIVVGTNLESSKSALDLARKNEGVFACVGIHPTEISPLPSSWEEDLIILAQDPRVVGVGEIGLDYFHEKSQEGRTLQKEIFLKQLHIAHKVGKTVQIHNRHAGEDVMALLEENEGLLEKVPGVFHCFAGDLLLLQRVLDRGFFIGVDGNVTYQGKAPGESVRLEEIVEAAPIERILTETDSPYLTPVPYRDSRNEPARVILVAEKIAQIKGLSLQEMETQVSINAHHLFGI